ncbi:MAG: hypothetical protein ABFR82_02575, partial [Nitrospirota bacterium]
TGQETLKRVQGDKPDFPQQGPVKSNINIFNIVAPAMTYFDAQTLYLSFFSIDWVLILICGGVYFCPGPLHWLYTYFSSVIILVFLNS